MAKIVRTEWEDEEDYSDLLGDDPRQLTPREAAFVREYLIDLSQANAARRAGFSEASAKDIAYQVMKRPHVRAAVDAAIAERAKRLDTTADEVLREIARMAMFDPAHVTGVTCPEDIAQLPEDVRRAIVGWGWDRRGNFTIKMAKETMLPLLAQHHGLVRQKVEHSGPGGGPIPIAPVTMSDEQLTAIAARALPANAAQS